MQQLPGICRCCKPRVFDWLSLKPFTALLKCFFGLKAATPAPEARVIPHLDNRYRRRDRPRSRLCLGPTAGLRLAGGKGCMAGCSKVGGAALLGEGCKGVLSFLQGPGRSGCGCGCLTRRLVQAWHPAGWGVGWGDGGVAHGCRRMAGRLLWCPWRQSLCTEAVEVTESGLVMPTWIERYTRV